MPSLKKSHTPEADGGPNASAIVKRPDSDLRGADHVTKLAVRGRERPGLEYAAVPLLVLAHVGTHFRGGSVCALGTGREGGFGGFESAEHRLGPRTWVCDRIRHLDSKLRRHHDASMRTTVTLEPDLADRLKEYAHRRRTSFKVALNTLLRRGLAAQNASSPRRPFAVEPHSGRLQPGLDPSKLNQLVDGLEVEDFVCETRGDR